MKVKDVIEFLSFFDETAEIELRATRQYTLKGSDLNVVIDIEGHAFELMTMQRMAKHFRGLTERQISLLFESWHTRNAERGAAITDEIIKDCAEAFDKISTECTCSPTPGVTEECPGCLRVKNER
jgi:hypothetical protein